MLFYIENGGFIYSDFILTSIDLIKCIYIRCILYTAAGSVSYAHVGLCDISNTFSFKVYYLCVICKHPVPTIC